MTTLNVGDRVQFTAAGPLAVKADDGGATMQLAAGIHKGWTVLAVNTNPVGVVSFRLGYAMASIRARPLPLLGDRGCWPGLAGVGGGARPLLTRRARSAG
jgi:hypothetical protein